MNEEQLRQRLAERLRNGTMTKEQAAYAVDKFREQQANRSFIEKTGDAITGAYTTTKEAITGGSRQTEQSRKATEIISAPPRAQGSSFGLQWNLKTNTNHEELLKSVAKEFGKENMFKDEKGNEYVRAKDGEIYIINKPGLSKQDIDPMVSGVMSTLGGGALVSLGKTALKKLGIGAAHSATAQAVIETGQEIGGGDFSSGDVAMAAGFGALGAAPSAIASKAKLSESAESLMPEITPEMKSRALNIKEKTGIVLSPLDVSDDDKAKVLDQLLKRNPSTSEMMAQNLKEKSKQTYNAVNDFMEKLADTEAAKASGINIRDTSIESIDNAKAFRTKETSKLYKDAFAHAREHGINADASLILDELRGISLKQSGKVKKDIDRLVKDLEGSMVPVDGSNIESLYNLKKDGIAAQLKDRKITGYTKTVYNQTRARINEMLAANSPLIKQADTRYAELSPPVDRVVGALGDISKIKDSEIRQVSSKLFNTDEFIANPQGFITAKEIINESNPEAWDALVRRRMEKGLIKAGATTRKEWLESKSNVTQDLYKNVFSGANKAILKESLDGDRKKNFLALADAMQIARLKTNNSMTESLQNARGIMNGEITVPKIYDVMLDVSAQLPLTSFFRRFSNAKFSSDKNATMLADIVTSPNWMNEVNEVRKSGFNTKEGGAKFLEIIKDYLKQEAPVAAATSTRVGIMKDEEQ